jgi:hypothetical protein
MLLHELGERNMLVHELGEENMLVHERVGGDRQKKR